MSTSRATRSRDDGRDRLSQIPLQWKRQFHGRNAANFGWGGDTTQNILWRLQNDDEEELAVLRADRVEQLLAGVARALPVDEQRRGAPGVIGVGLESFREDGRDGVGVGPVLDDKEIAHVVPRGRRHQRRAAAGRERE